MFIELSEVEYPRDQWQSNGGIIGLQDLNEAQVFFAVRALDLTEQLASDAPALGAVLISFQMENHPFSFEDFRISSHTNNTPRLAGDRLRTNWNWIVFEATFPDLKKATSGELFKPFPKME